MPKSEERKQITVRVTLEPEPDVWVVDWKKMQTLEHVMDLLWHLTRSKIWLGAEPPTGIEHLVKRYGE